MIIIKEERKASRRVGFIGVGEIARAMVIGMCDGADQDVTVLLSPRGAEVGADLAARFSSVSVCASNQDVADGASVLIVSVRPADAPAALQGLRIDDQTFVISVMAGVSHDRLRESVGAAAVVRAIPMPAVRDRACVTPIYPLHPLASAFFDPLGGTLPVDSESALEALSAVTGSVSSYFEYLSCVANWAVEQGIPGPQAESYVRGLFGNLGPALTDHDRSLGQLVNDHETAGGINEQLRCSWLNESNTQLLRGALDAVLKRLHPVSR